MLSEMLTRAHMYTRNWNLRWTQLESTLNAMRVIIENVSFGYILIFEIWISEVSVPATGGPSDVQTWGTHPADEKGCEALSSR